MKIKVLKSLAEKAKSIGGATVQVYPKDILQLINRNEELTDALIDARLYVPRGTLKLEYINEVLDKYASYIDMED